MALKTFSGPLPTENLHFANVAFRSACRPRSNNHDRKSPPFAPRGAQPGFSPKLPRIPGRVAEVAAKGASESIGGPEAEGVRNFIDGPAIVRIGEPRVAGDEALQSDLARDDALALEQPIEPASRYAEHPAELVGRQGL